MQFPGSSGVSVPSSGIGKKQRLPEYSQPERTGLYPAGTAVPIISICKNTTYFIIMNKCSLL
jgi:hypothetical protein